MSMLGNWSEGDNSSKTPRMIAHAAITYNDATAVMPIEERVDAYFDVTSAKTRDIS